MAAFRSASAFRVLLFLSVLLLSTDAVLSPGITRKIGPNWGSGLHNGSASDANPLNDPEAGKVMPNHTALLSDHNIVDFVPVPLLKMDHTFARGGEVAVRYHIDIFFRAMFASIVWCASMFAGFSWLRPRFPWVYSGNVETNKAPFVPPSSTCGWFRASLSFTSDEVSEYVGLDQAMLLEFFHFSIKLMIKLALPVVFILSPCHWLNSASNIASITQENTLLLISVSSNQPKLFWWHAFIVWWVVVSVQTSALGAHARFVLRRKDWLMDMPEPRASTVFVQDIPHEYATDEELQNYFNFIFGADVVQDAIVVKRTGELRAALQERSSCFKACHFQQDRQPGESGQTEIPKPLPEPEGESLCSSSPALVRLAQADAAVDAARSAIVEASNENPASVNTSAGFVTFEDRRTAEVCMALVLNDDTSTFVMSRAPDPTDILYIHLERTPQQQRWDAIIGGALILLIFVATALLMFSLRKLDGMHLALTPNRPGVTLFFDALKVSAALQLVLTLMPAVFARILRFFNPATKADLQCLLHKYFFLYQIYIVMLTPLCSSKVSWAGESFNPGNILALICNSLPYVSRVFLNFVLLNWVVQAHSLLRCEPLTRFIAFPARASLTEVKERIEPESLESCGVGVRTARESFIVVLALIFCSLAPFITLLALVNSIIGRVVYGYLIVFAETKKADLGGEFWIKQMSGIQLCVPIYICLMTGTLIAGGGGTLNHPAAVALSSLGFWLLTYRRLQRMKTFLCLEEINDAKDPSRFVSRHTPILGYRQPELSDEALCSNRVDMTDVALKTASASSVLSF